VKSSFVHFFVVRTTNWSIAGTMPFEKEYLNLGGGMNLASGVFTAPKPGIYAFNFVGTGFGSGSSYAGFGFVYLQRNGADVAIGFSDILGATAGTRATVSVHGTLKLNKGDTITIRHVATGGSWISTMHSNGKCHTQFSGSLMEEDLVIS